MEVLSKLIESIDDYEIKDSFVGVFETLIQSRYYGVSSTLRPIEKRKDTSIKIIGNSTLSVSKLALSENPLEASIGIATINSVLNRDSLNFEYINAYDLILNSNNVGVVGRFPFIEKLKNKVNKLFVFELFPIEGEYHSKYLKNYINDLDILAVTATTLINHTFEDIIRYKTNKTKLIMLGPSTPLSPILFDYGVDIISGTIVSDKDLFINGIKEGKGFKNLKGRESVSIVKI
jgi:hypothetical protein